MAQKPKFKPWPKLPKIAGQAGPALVDLEKLREMYVSGPYFPWGQFCRFHGFNENMGRNKWELRGFNFEDWQAEWLRRQTKLQDQDLAPQLLEIRKAIGIQRVKFVKDWTSRTAYMKTLLDAVMKPHGEDLQHDMQNTLAIQAGRVQKKFKLSADEIQTWAAVSDRLHALEQRTLMITGIELKKPDEEKNDDGPEEIPQIEVLTMGQTGMSGEQITALMAGYFDQLEKPKQIEVKADVSAPAQEDQV